VLRLPRRLVRRSCLAKVEASERRRVYFVVTISDLPSSAFASRGLSPRRSQAKAGRAKQLPNLATKCVKKVRFSLQEFRPSKQHKFANSPTKPHIWISKTTSKPRSLQLSHPTHAFFATKLVFASKPPLRHPCVNRFIPKKTYSHGQPLSNPLPHNSAVK
jgi:hypothetical protein